MYSLSVNLEAQEHRAKKRTCQVLLVAFEDGGFWTLNKVKVDQIAVICLEEIWQNIQADVCSD